MTGVLLVDKDEGVSSAGAIRALAPVLGGAKVGHLGTLDPFASGLLPLCLGDATKVAGHLLLEDKAYAGSIRLGVETDTLDRTGATTGVAEVPALDDGLLAEVAARFTGVIEQVPPMFSAIKRGGVPLYKLARRGEAVERASRRVEIRALVLRLAAGDRVDLVVSCSKGTYVRVLAADVARALGTVGHLSMLRRTAVGSFVVDAAWPVSRLLVAQPDSWPLVPIRRALAGLASFSVGQDAIMDLRCGRQGILRTLPPGHPGQTAVVVSDDDEVEAVVEAGADGGWRLSRIVRGTPLQGG